jgi:hypothetical protein
MEAFLTYASMRERCTASWLHQHDEDEMSRFVYKFDFDPSIARKYGCNSAVFKTGPSLKTELETYDRLTDLQGFMRQHLLRSGTRR